MGEVVELEEGSGGTNAIAEVEAMVVSPETFPAVEKINVQRREKGFADMVPVLIEYVGGGSEDTRVSSTKLRQLEMQRKHHADIRVSSKHTAGFYTKAIKKLCQGGQDSDGNAKEAISTFTIAGLGDAVSVAVAVASFCDRDKLATITKI